MTTHFVLGHVEFLCSLHSQGSQKDDTRQKELNNGRQSEQEHRIQILLLFIWSNCSKYKQNTK